jgi:adenylate cyclase class 2
MIEVEVKARALPDTLQKIKALGAVLVGTESHHDLYFNSPMHDFRKSDEALRIRVKNGAAGLTYKGPKLDGETKSRLELTTTIDDPKAAEQILLSLGFLPSGEVKKSRTKYALGDIVFAMDDVEGLGSFLEVEMAGAKDWESQRRRVLDILSTLGIAESIRKSYLELLLEARSKER